MQNQQMQMAMNVNGGPVNGTPVMANMNMAGPPQRQPMDPREQLNTYIYDYFLRNNHNRLARAMVECDMKMSTTPSQKTSPGNKPNGMDSIDDDSTNGLPNPLLPKNQMADNSFLLDWWIQFWDIYQATKDRSGQPSKGAQYIQHTRVRRLPHSTRLPANRAAAHHPDAERAAQPAHDDEQPHERPVPERGQHDARKHAQRRCAERPQARSSAEQPPVREPRQALPHRLPC